MMHRLFLLAVPALPALLSGCASRYGHRNEQTFIDVRTQPERLAYVVLAQGDAQRFVQLTAEGLRVSDPQRFQELVGAQLQGLESNGALLHYTTGSYLLAVQCPRGWRFRQFTAAVNTKNVVDLACS